MIEIARVCVGVHIAAVDGGIHVVRLAQQGLAALRDALVQVDRQAYVLTQKLADNPTGRLRSVDHAGGWVTTVINVNGLPFLELAPPPGAQPALKLIRTLLERNIQQPPHHGILQTGLGLPSDHLYIYLGPES